MGFNAQVLDNLIKLLANPDLAIPSRVRSRKKLKHLKALAETMNQLERNTNFLLYQVLNGNREKEIITTSNKMDTHSDDLPLWNQRNYIT
jgi:hypothetical protein